MFVYNFHLLIKFKKSENIYEKVQKQILYIKEKGEFRVQDTESRKFFLTNQCRKASCWGFFSPYYFLRLIT